MREISWGGTAAHTSQATQAIRPRLKGQVRVILGFNLFKRTPVCLEIGELNVIQHLFSNLHTVLVHYKYNYSL